MWPPLQGFYCVLMKCLVLPYRLIVCLKGFSSVLYNNLWPLRKSLMMNSFSTFYSSSLCVYKMDVACWMFSILADCLSSLNYTTGRSPSLPHSQPHVCQWNKGFVLSGNTLLGGHFLLSSHHTPDGWDIAYAPATSEGQLTKRCCP